MPNTSIRACTLQSLRHQYCFPLECHGWYELGASHTATKPLHPSSSRTPQEDLRVALHAYFRVGLPGGKTLQRFDELMQALDEDQPGPNVQWATIFEEDREFNQGEWVVKGLMEAVAMCPGCHAV